MPAEYLQQILHRSASYTYRLPLKIGGLSSGAPDSEIANLAKVGEQIGLAFQIVDDILNVDSSDEHWGKAKAEDLSQGKITLQVILALERGSEKQKERLSQILMRHTTDPGELSEAVLILKDTGAVKVLEKYAPGISNNPMIGLAKGMTLKSLLAMPQAKDAGITEDMVKKVLTEINALKK